MGHRPCATIIASPGEDDATSWVESNCLRNCRGGAERGISVQGQTPKASYSAMAPLAQYMMDPSTEIALARSAAPKSISGDAEALVLGRAGF